MRMWRRAATMLLASALVCAGASAQGTQRAYGGRGEDRLLEMTQAGGGIFAVGMTMSDDGDLSMRTRTGESGWAMLADENGERVWSYASAHTGLARMICPAALEDGRYALVLTDEQAQRGEWLMLDSRGALLLRVPVSPQALGLEGKHTVLAYCQSGGSPASLTMILEDAQTGALCAAAIDENGGVRVGMPFMADGKGCAASDLRGRLAWACVSEGGGLSVAWLEQGEITQSCGLVLAGFETLEICDALLLEDGSVVCCGAAKEGGFVARASYEGEVLFVRQTDSVQRHLCQTETGYAACGEGEDGTQIAFFDEDGAALYTAAGLPADALDLCGAMDGAALLTYEPGHRQKQAVITHIAQAEAAPPQETQEEAEPEIEAEISVPAAQISMADGYLICSADGSYGVKVRCMAGDGSEIFSTRTPIHTAADALEWICAARMDGGSILLGGRYLFGAGPAQRQMGVIALLDGSGVLRSIRTIDGAGAVCGIEIDAQGGVTLHTAGSEALSLDANGEIPLDISAM